MDYQRNKKYFTQKENVVPVIVSGILIALGFILIVFLSNTRGMSTWLMRSIGLVCLAVGAVVALIYTNVRIKDSETDGDVEEIKKKFYADFKDHFDKLEVRRLRSERQMGQAQQKYDPVFFGTYSFDGAEDGKILVKRGSDGKSRSSVYSQSGFWLRSNSVCLAERKESLVEDSVLFENFTEYRYTELGEAVLVETEASGYSGVTKYEHLRITDTDGKTIIEFPILGDADADGYAAEINSVIIKAKKTAENGDNI